jgi:hypothetical protein
MIDKSSNFSKYFGVYSSLNADLSKIHIINNFKYNCRASFEDAKHYFLKDGINKLADVLSLHLGGT